jgi:hypothetical protein
LPPYETWAVVFSDALKFSKFREKYEACLWEMKHQTPWSKAGAEDQTYALKTWNGFAEVDMEDGTDYSHSESEEEPSGQSQEKSETEEEEEAEESDDNIQPPGDNLTNSNLVVGHNKDRAFVVRGSKIGVFATGGDKIAYSTTMKSMKDKKGNEFVPDQVSSCSILLSKSGHLLCHISIGHAPRSRYLHDCYQS